MRSSSAIMSRMNCTTSSIMSEFVDFYNHHHRHTGIGLHTPGDVHYGLADATQNRRLETLAAAREQHPNRFTTSNTPKILTLPATAWINQPTETDQNPAA
jgi:putative transposase